MASIYLSVTSSIAAAALLVALWKALLFVIRPYLSPLRSLPGPPNPSWFFGQMKQMWEVDDPGLAEHWVEQYGHSITFTGLFNINRLYTTDPRALHHILNTTDVYQRSGMSRANVRRILGSGILTTEGEEHRHQRRIMNPAFAPAHIRELTGIFFDKAIQLRDIWAKKVQQDAPVRVNALEALNKMTLDIIGLAGFNYAFNALNEDGTPNELAEAFQRMFSADHHPNLLARLQHVAPIFRIIPTERVRQVNEAQKVLHRIGMKLIQEKKADISAHAAAEKRGVKRDDLQGRDLLTLLIKANMATDIPESQRLSDEDVLAQVPTFLIAGHETTSTTATWCLFALTQNPMIQDKLREELLSVPEERPSMDDLTELPYLDMVVRETLRLHAPVPHNLRSAVKDDVIPLNEPFVDKHGNVCKEIRIAKGDMLMIPIIALNRSKRIWGEDAYEFKPERWENPPPAAAEIPGVFSHLMTFIGGPRACIGYKFSIVEIKAIIFTLVRSFEFKLAVRPEDVVKRSGIVQRPIVLSEPQGGNQMPLLISPVQGATF
ncbi:cytochrome P450 [Panus rudis PR-1116 ss-1]|nr:cytochrome P450 [Panus rudis PR-1116 ss-1]